MYEFDAIIVGSGAGGAMAAFALTRMGLKCLMLEAGRDYDPAAETNMTATADQAPLRGTGTPDKPFGYFDATINGGWQVPGEPYTVAEGSEFTWWRSRMLGGRTNHWGRHVPRFGPYDFKGFSRDGLGTDWPISYDDLAPWYDRTEQLIGVNGGHLGLENHPDSPPGILHKPATPRVPELLVAAAAKSLGIPTVLVHSAILTRDVPHPAAPRRACFNASPCGNGCSIGAAFQTTTSLLPMAKATGRLKIVTGAMAARVVMRSANRADGIEYVDTATGQRHTVRARSVVLAASALETTRLLLNSRSAEHPAGLANASGQLGRNITDTVGATLDAYVPGLENRPYYNEFGTSVPHMYIPFWLYKEQAAGKLDFPRGYHFELSGRFGPPSPGTLPSIGYRGYGRDLKQAIRRSYGAFFAIVQRGEMIPNAQTFAEIDPVVKDRFGIPVLRFHWHWSRHELNQVAHGMETARAIVQKMGGRVLTPDRPPEKAIGPGGLIIHEAGGARMGSAPTQSVTNAYGQTWEVDNLVLADGAMFTSNAHKNLTLTIMALAWRSSEHLAKRLKSGELA